MDNVVAISDFVANVAAISDFVVNVVAISDFGQFEKKIIHTILYLSRFIGCKISTMSKYKNGREPVSSLHIRKISAVRPNMSRLKHNCNLVWWVRLGLVWSWFLTSEDHSHCSRLFADSRLKSNNTSDVNIKGDCNRYSRFTERVKIKYLVHGFYKKIKT